MDEKMCDAGDGAQLRNLPVKLTKDPKNSAVRAEVLLNAYELSMGDKVKSVFQHEVKFHYTTDRGKLRELHKGPKNDVANISRQMLAWELFEMLLVDYPDFFGGKKDICKFVYDCGVGLYSLKRLRIEEGESMSFVVSAGRLSEKSHAYIGKYDGKINVELYACGEVPLDARKAAVGDANRYAIQFLEILSNQELIRRGEYHIYAQKIFKKKSLIRLNNDPRILKEGMQKNVRYVGDSLRTALPVLQIDPKKSAFFPNISETEQMPVVRFVAEFLSCRDALEREIFSRNNLQIAAKQLKGLIVITTHLKHNRQFEVNGLTDKTADATKFEREGQEVTVAKYFQEMYQMRLKSPGLPCAIEKRPKVNGINQNSFYPLEVLKIVDGQRVPLHKQTPQLTEQMIRQCQSVPSVFVQQVEQEKRNANLDNKNEYFQLFGISISARPIRANAEILFPPAIVYNGEVEEPDRNGRMNWKMTPNRHYLIPASAPNVWVVAIIRSGVSERDCENFIDVILQSARKRGVDIRKPTKYDRFDSTDVGRIRERFHLYKKNKVSFFMFFTKDKLDPVHHTMKMMEVEFGIITQHVSGQTLSKAIGNRGAFMVIDNILMKTNLKLGGVNHALTAARENRNMRPDVVRREWFGDSRMYIGIDLSHAASQTLYERQAGIPCTTPTVVGMAYTLGEPAKIIGTYWYQETRITLVQELATNVMEAVTNYRDSVGKFPRHIIVFRGGVSEGEYQKIVDSEQAAFTKAFHELAKIDNQFRAPYLTVIVVQRNSNYRIVPPDPDRNARPPEQNVRPGTCVDVGIMHPTLTEFLLVPHKAIQGTAKPIRCTVIWDSVPDRMSLDELENITHMLCYAHGIVMSPVSVPAPLYSAGDLAKRGRNTLKEYNGADNSSCSGGNESADVANLSRKLKTALRTKYWA